MCAQSLLLYAQLHILLLYLNYIMLYIIFENIYQSISTLNEFLVHCLLYVYYIFMYISMCLSRDEVEGFIKMLCNDLLI